MHTAADGYAAGYVADYGSGYVGDLLNPTRVEEAERLHRQYATLRGVLDELERGLALVPPDAGTFWRSEAHHAYAARLYDLRRMLAHAHVGLQEALSSIEISLAALAA